MRDLSNIKTSSTPPTTTKDTKTSMVNEVMNWNWHFLAYLIGNLD